MLRVFERLVLSDGLCHTLCAVGGMVLLKRQEDDHVRTTPHRVIQFEREVTFHPSHASKANHESFHTIIYCPLDLIAVLIMFLYSPQSWRFDVVVFFHATKQNV